MDKIWEYSHTYKQQNHSSTVIDLDPHFNIKPIRGSRLMANEIRSLRSLHDLKDTQLHKIRAWQDCPDSYRDKLYNKIDAIDLSKKTASENLDEIIREIGLLEFTLQLNSDWHRGVLTLGDEIVDQTDREQRNTLITRLGQFKEELGLLMQACLRYHDVQAGLNRANTDRQN